MSNYLLNKGKRNKEKPHIKEIYRLLNINMVRVQNSTSSPKNKSLFIIMLFQTYNNLSYLEKHDTVPIHFHCKKKD